MDDRGGGNWSLYSGLLAPSNSPIITVSTVVMEVQAEYFPPSRTASVQLIDKRLRHVLKKGSVRIEGRWSPDAVLTKSTMELLGAIHILTAVNYDPTLASAVHHYLDDTFIIPFDIA